MTLTDELKILDDKIKQIKFSMTYTEKQLKFLYSHLKNWININI